MSNAAQKALALMGQAPGYGELLLHPDGRVMFVRRTSAYNNLTATSYIVPTEANFGGYRTYQVAVGEFDWVALLNGAWTRFRPIVTRSFEHSGRVDLDHVGLFSAFRWMERARDKRRQGKGVGPGWIHGTEEPPEVKAWMNEVSWLAYPDQFDTKLRELFAQKGT